MIFLSTTIQTEFILCTLRGIFREEKKALLMHSLFLKIYYSLKLHPLKKIQCTKIGENSEKIWNSLGE